MSLPERFGGSGLAAAASVPVVEFLAAANPAFDMYTGWGDNSAAILIQSGDEDLCQRYLPPLVSGEWAGSMALTEPQAGTDLGLVRTRAVPQSDGSFALTGSKIFNSGADHDLTENIIHFVLARIVGAAEGTKGLSLFLVPKVLLRPDGSLGECNRVFCTGVEHKMGLHGSATCAMSYDGATGFLIGRPGEGLSRMFRLMNHMRRRTGTIALGASDIAFQNAHKYANERLQGRAPGQRNPSPGPSPLIAQPDVRRILLDILSFNEAARALLFYAAL